MNLNVLQNVTPIKHEDGKRKSTRPSSLTTNCSYFNVNEWQDGEDVPDASCIFVTPPPCNASPPNELCFPQQRTAEARKSLFREDSNESVNEQKIDQIGSDNGAVLSQDENLSSSNMQKDLENFSDVWNTQLNFNQDDLPLYSFSDNTNEYQNVLRVDVLSEFQEFTQSTEPAQTDAMTQATQQSSGYTSYQNGNGMIRSYSNELNQQMTSHQSNMSSLNNHQMGIHHMGYQATSPNAGDGSNSTHNSPFTTSPSQGFDYPTTPPMKPSIPPNTDYPGDYNFNINFGEATESAPKSAQYTFSHPLNKLFVKMNVTCPIHFKCDTPAPMGSRIRAIPVFKRPEHITDIVTRCPNHKIPDEANFVPSSGHLIRAEMPDDSVRYIVAGDLRESVTVRYERPQIGAEFTTILYKFMCLSSCVGGINRRPLLTVFNLENADGQVLGRRVVEVRICSCPGRDRAQEEKRKFSDSSAATSNGQDKTSKRPYKNMQSSLEINQTGKKRRVVSNNNDQEEFILKVRGRDKFLMLKKVKEALDLMEYVTPQQQEAYRNREEQDQTIFRQQLSSDAACKNAPQSREAKEPVAPSIASVFTVSNPLTSDTAASTIDSLMCPTHSSHPLTTTPTGVMATPGDDCPPTSFQDPITHPHHPYWTVDGSQLGCDIPDTSDPLHSTPSTSSWTHAPEPLRTPHTVLACNTGMSRELSGTSTVSASSGSSNDSSAQGRYVTRVLLRQTLSLNRDAKTRSDWLVNDDCKEQGDFSWDSQVKNEKKDDSLSGCHDN